MNLASFCKGVQEVGFALFGLAILWGAVKIMFAGEDDKVRIEGKNIVKNAVIGLILILLASQIAKFFSTLNLQPITILP